MMKLCSRPAKKAKRGRRNEPNWLELPRDLIAKILQKLDVVEIVLNASQVCSLWWKICNDPSMWHTIVMTNLQSSPYNLVNICSRAVRRSCGLVEEINIEHFATDELINFIANSCTSNLRRLRLVHCEEVTMTTAFVEILKNSPLLEELDISFSSVALVDIGMIFPLLKVLKCNQVGFDAKYSAIKAYETIEVVYIAKTMPGLRHLQIMGSGLTDYGLLAILNGCPMLEFLDLRACYNVDLSGSLGKKCREQIRELRLPHDEDKSSDDYPKIIL